MSKLGCKNIFWAKIVTTLSLTPRSTANFDKITLKEVDQKFGICKNMSWPKKKLRFFKNLIWNLEVAEIYVLG